MENSSKRILFIHAHPDDETLATGGTIAEYTHQGAQVTVLTATRGERGEVIPESLRYLEGDRAALAAYREAELAQAMRVLGVNDHRYLGASDAKAADAPVRTYEDSGMRWGSNHLAEPADDASDASLAVAPLKRVAADVEAVIRDVRPHAIVTYNAIGGYRHPDHVRVHDATMLAFDNICSDPSWQGPLPGVFAIERPASAARADATYVRAHSSFSPLPAKGPAVISDRSIDAVLDARPLRDVVLRAVACYRTQAIIDGDVVAMSNRSGTRVGGYEYFREIGGAVRREAGAKGVANDLVHGWGPTPLRRTDARDASPAPTVRTRVTSAAWAALLGILVGAVGTVAHMQTLDNATATVRVPTGFVAATVAVLATVFTIRLGYQDRWRALWFAGGVYAAIAVLSLQPQGGSVLVTATPLGMVWGFGVPIVAVLCAVVPLPWRFRGQMR